MHSNSYKWWEKLPLSAQKQIYANLKTWENGYSLAIMPPDEYESKLAHYAKLLDEVLEEGKYSIPKQRVSKRAFKMFEEIEGLMLYEFEATNFFFLEHFKNLKALSLEKSNLKDTSFLKGLPRLEKLYLGGNSITTFSNTVLPCLKLLDVSDNRISGGLALDAPKLKVLNLSANELSSKKINNFDAILSSYPYLEELDLGGNEISRLCGLSLPRLCVLDLSGNSIRGFQDLNLPCLETLRMHHTQCDTNLLGIIDLKSLKYIYFSFSHLQDPTPLKKLEKLKKIDFYICTVTESDIIDLQNALPGCEITHY
jgi:Leucine-rich repeat (LRR) protein